MENGLGSDSSVLVFSSPEASLFNHDAFCFSKRLFMCLRMLKGLEEKMDATQAAYDGLVYARTMADQAFPRSAEPLSFIQVKEILNLDTLFLKVSINIIKFNYGLWFPILPRRGLPKKLTRLWHLRSRSHSLSILIDEMVQCEGFQKWCLGFCMCPKVEIDEHISKEISNDLVLQNRFGV